MLVFLVDGTGGKIGMITAWPKVVGFDAVSMLYDQAARLAQRTKHDHSAWTIIRRATQSTRLSAIAIRHREAMPFLPARSVTMILSPRIPGRRIHPPSACSFSWIIIVFGMPKEERNHGLARHRVISHRMSKRGKV